MKKIELHRAISEDNQEQADKILKDFAIKWFIFGVGVGFTIAYCYLLLVSHLLGESV